MLASFLLAHESENVHTTVTTAAEDGVTNGMNGPYRPATSSSLLLIMHVCSVQQTADPTLDVVADSPAVTYVSDSDKRPMPTT